MLLSTVALLCGVHPLVLSGCLSLKPLSIKGLCNQAFLVTVAHAMTMMVHADVL